MKWRIEGAWRENGEDAELIVEAVDASAAQAIASKKGLLVASVVPLGGAMPYASSPVIINNTEPSRGVSGLGIAALVLGIISCLVAWVPFVGVVSLPISLIGLLLGVIGITIAAASKRQSMAMAVAGSIVCVVAIGLVLALTVLPLGAVVTAAGSAAQNRPTTSATVPAPPVTPPPAVSFAPDPVGEVPPAEQPPAADAPAVIPDENPLVVDASKSRSIEVGDVRVTLEGVWKSRPSFSRYGDTVTGADDNLIIDVTISNLATTRRLSYRPWMDDPRFGEEVMTLRDEHDNLYRRISMGFGSFPAGGVEDPDSVNPGVGLRDRFVFEVPIDAAQRLRLKLPLSYVGGDGEAVFEIPRSMISVSPPPRI
jgi:hypothetical protein